MDSGNSGSLQSSSGGDEEYDSRAAAAAAAHSFFMNRPISNPPPPLLFDPFSNYTPWPRPMRSDPNPSTSHVALNPVTFPAPAGENKELPGAAARNPRKRPRASRRAPTTVLTTDTANFRAMVQEFTGIPSPPFSGPSFQRSRLDLFTAAPPYLRRPFLASSTDSSVASSTPINYQLPITQNSNLFQNQNSLTSLLQSNPRFLFSNSDVIASSKTHENDPFSIPTMNDGQFNLSHHQIHASTSSSPNVLPNLISPDQMKMMTASRGGGGGYGFSDGKMDFPAPPPPRPPAPDIRGGKGAENLVTRSEGMVESWICSSE